MCSFRIRKYFSVMTNAMKFKFFFLNNSKFTLFLIRHEFQLKGRVSFFRIKQWIFLCTFVKFVGLENNRFKYY